MKPMRRRNFIALIGGVAAWPFAARAQQPALPVVGYLSGSTPKASREASSAFLNGLAEAGYQYLYGPGQNVNLIANWAWGHSDWLPERAADLAKRQVAVIATAGVPETLAAKATTTTIPIVFAIEGDPIAAGLIPTLDRPGSNVTGVAVSKMQVGPKQLELLHQVIPTATTVALLVNPTNPAAEPLVRDAQAAARSLGLQLHVLKASVAGDIDAAFAALPGLQAGGLVIGSDQFFDSRSLQIAALALEHSVPAIYQHRAFTAAGGLISYGASLADAFQLAGVYTGRILNGEKPADLAVRQSTKVELLINLKTAKALGVTILPELLDRADEAIE
jgi:putative tryptophan/tyrosine transport system substrate-binding protein